MLLVLGTHNKKKGIELRALLEPHGFDLKTLSEVERPIEVVEDGDSFQANARLKAVKQAVHLNAWVLGEDSGLCVDALDGRPGIYSARFAGLKATDADNNDRLLRELRGVPLAKRSAHYVCHMSLSDPDGQVMIDCEALCYGRILEAPRGVGGFGYDPLFELPEYRQTFAELGAEVKSVLSHRSRAMRQFLPAFLRLVEHRKPVTHEM